MLNTLKHYKVRNGSTEKQSVSEFQLCCPRCVADAAEVLHNRERNTPIKLWTLKQTTVNMRACGSWKSFPFSHYWVFLCSLVSTKWIYKVNIEPIVANNSCNSFNTDRWALTGKARCSSRSWNSQITVAVFKCQIIKKMTQHIHTDITPHRPIQNMRCFT